MTYEIITVEKFSNPCVRCGAECDGTIMHHHPRFTKVKKKVTDELIPRTQHGKLRLCHRCQRTASSAGGFLMMLAIDLKEEAKKARDKSVKSD